MKWAPYKTVRYNLLVGLRHQYGVLFNLIGGFMAKRAIIIIGLILGALGTAGSLLMLATGAENASPVGLVVWGIVFILSLYFLINLEKKQ